MQGYLLQENRPLTVYRLRPEDKKFVQQSAVKKDVLQCNCWINFDDINILAKYSTKIKLLLKAGLSIKRNNPIPNPRIISMIIFLITMKDLFPVSHDFHISYEFITVILLYIMISLE